MVGTLAGVDRRDLISVGRLTCQEGPWARGVSRLRWPMAYSVVYSAYTAPDLRIGSSSSEG
jgi:hypothetical protein